MTTVDLNGIRNTIKKLEEFMRLASDPAIAPYVSLNGDGNPGSATRAAVKRITPRSKENGLKPAVLEASKILGEEITVATVYEYLTKTGFQMSSTSPRKAIGQVLRMLAKDHKLRITEKGSGRKAVIYAVQ
jgi:phenylalanyl-tRNA synthetase beta subunit